MATKQTILTSLRGALAINLWRRSKLSLRHCEELLRYTYDDEANYPYVIARSSCDIPMATKQTDPYVIARSPCDIPMATKQTILTSLRGALAINLWRRSKRSLRHCEEPLRYTYGDEANYPYVIARSSCGIPMATKQTILTSLRGALAINLWRRSKLIILKQTVTSIDLNLYDIFDKLREYIVGRLQ